MTSTSTTRRCDVVIIGAGPVGMTAALLIAARGLQVVVIERNNSTSDEPKAISLDDESLRVYQSPGLIDEIMSIIVPGTGTRYYASDDQVLFHGRAAQPYRFGYPFKNPFAQPDLERVLHRAMARCSTIELLYGTEFIGLDQQRDGVTATTAGRHPLTIAAAFVLGADGGRSRLRSELGITMTGRSHKETWLVIDTLEDSRTERYGMHHGDPERPYVVVPGLDGRCRYEFLLHDGEGEPTDAPPFELIRRLVSPYRQIEPHQVERAVNYRFNSLVADNWRSGRAFLLGDAAHMMAPFAGQGLNSGIRDAANLAWKIAAVHDGLLGHDQLDTYEAERRPHAEQVVQFSARLGRVVMTTNRRIAECRDRAVERALRTESGRDYFEQMKYRPLPRLGQGMIIPSPDGAMVGDAVGQPRVFDVGSRAVTLLDDMLGDDWAILGVDVAPAAWQGVRTSLKHLGARLIDIPYDDTMPESLEGISIAIDVDMQLYREFESVRGHFVLVRPDRYICASWLPSETEDIAQKTHSWIAAPAIEAVRELTLS